MGKHKSRTSRGGHKSHTRTIWREVERSIAKQEHDKGKAKTDQNTTADQTATAASTASASSQCDNKPAVEQGKGLNRGRPEDRHPAFQQVKSLDCNGIQTDIGATGRHGCSKPADES